MDSIKKIERKIKDTDYWDVDILDFRISSFGDELSMYVYNDEESCWKITFFTCRRVSYETDADWREIAYGRMMKKPQLGYYGQRIDVSESECSGFYKVDMDLTIMNVEIECKEIEVEKINRNEVQFFWED